MDIKRLLPIAGAAVAIGLGGTAAAGVADTHAGSIHRSNSSQEVSAWDKQWLQMSIEGDLFEIAGGRIAQDNAGSEAVRAYGRRLIEDHTKTLKDAVDLAHRLGIEVPRAPSPSQQWQLDEVSMLKGREFDQRWVDLEAKDHQQDISEAKDEVKEGENEQVRQNAKDDLPTLKEHLEIALRLGGKLATEPLSE